MTDSKNDKELRALYRGFIREEMNRPEIQQDKKLFIDTYFPSQSVWAVGKGIFNHGLAWASLVILFVLLVEPQKVPFDAWQQKSESSHVSSGRPEESFTPFAGDSQEIEVKRLTSRVGPTMVYRKSYQDVPVTIIWVFTNGASV